MILMITSIAFPWNNRWEQTNETTKSPCKLQPMATRRTWKSIPYNSLSRYLHERSLGAKTWSHRSSDSGRCSKNSRLCYNYSNSVILHAHLICKGHINDMRQYPLVLSLNFSHQIVFNSYVFGESPSNKNLFFEKIIFS